MNDVSLVDETQALQRELAALGAYPEWGFLARHDLLAQKTPVSFKDRAWRKLRSTLAVLRVMPPHVTDYPWLPVLKHARQPEGPRTLLIWALGAEKEALREACRTFVKRLENTAFVPVLVTDVADFAFYSRLGWLVEYLPELRGEGQSYRERKRRYLAWRYRGAFAVPWRAGLADEEMWRTVVPAEGA